MRGSFRLGTVFGIDVRIHWTFFLLLMWVGGAPLVSGATLAVAALNLLLVCAVFACVVAHEYGHALAARYYGIATKDITLLPIGGVARLPQIPAEPFKELVVAVAGPVVNVVIAGLIAAGLFAFGGSLWQTPATYQTGFSGGGFLQTLMLINLFLVVFNAIPAFPMDGGRVFRAFLAMRYSRVSATDMAAVLGQVIAICFGLIGLFGNPMLILIAVFIYFGAKGEAEHVRYAALIGKIDTLILGSREVHWGEYDLEKQQVNVHRRAASGVYRST